MFAPGFCLPPTCCLEHNPETSSCLLLFGFVSPQIEMYLKQCTLSESKQLI